MINHRFYAVRDDARRGWFGQYTLIKDGRSRVQTVKDAYGFGKLFNTASDAKKAASEALCLELDKRERPSSNLKTYDVKYRGGKSRAYELAERIFGGSH